MFHGVKMIKTNHQHIPNIISNIIHPSSNAASLLLLCHGRPLSINPTFRQRGNLEHAPENAALTESPTEEPIGLDKGTPVRFEIWMGAFQTACRTLASPPPVGLALAHSGQ